MNRVALVVAALWCGACSKPPAGSAAEPIDAAPVAASASAPSPATPPAKATAAQDWAGHYTSSAGNLYIPPDWKGVRWSVADSPAGLGDGALSLRVDSTTGRVTGAVDGPLGPATVDGFAGDGGVTGTLARKDPSDRGFTGTLVGAVDGDKLTGTLQMSAADVNAVRKATFSLTRP